MKLVLKLWICYPEQSDTDDDIVRRLRTALATKHLYEINPLSETKWEIRKDDGNSYFVNYKEGRLYCTCWDYKVRKKNTDGWCKHKLLLLIKNLLPENLVSTLFFVFPYLNKYFNVVNDDDEI